MFSIINSQNVVFTDKGEKSKYIHNEYILQLDKGIGKVEVLQEDKKEFASFLVTAAPKAVEIAFKSIKRYLEKREKSFVGEYETSISNPHCLTTLLPEITFTRKLIILNEETLEKALELKVVPVKIENSKNLYYFRLDDFNLKYSKARTKSGKISLDYAIEIIPQTLKMQDNMDDSKVLETGTDLKIDPIKIMGMSFKKLAIKKNEYRSGIFSIPKGNIVVGLKIKIVESNPGKIEAEKVLELFNTYEEDAKTIINYILPGKASSENNTTNKGTGSPTGTVGNK